MLTPGEKGGNANDWDDDYYESYDLASMMANLALILLFVGGGCYVLNKFGYGPQFIRHEFSERFSNLGKYARLNLDGDDANDSQLK